MRPRALAKHLNKKSLAIRRLKAGFSLVEIVTAVAIVAVLGAIIMYSYSPETPNDSQRYAAVAAALSDIAAAIAAPDYLATASTTRSFFGRELVYPAKLSDLTDPITTSEKNICNNSGSAYTATQVGKWIPYYFRDLRDGTPLARGFAVQDNLVLIKKPALAPSNVGKMAIQMTNVDTVDAKMLDLTIDGALDATAGRIIYSTTATTTPVDYIMPFLFTAGC